MHDGEDGVLERSTADLLRELNVSPAGLTSNKVRQRLARSGETGVGPERRTARLHH